MANRYWHANYWEPDYFSDTWWADDPGTDRLGQIAATVGLDTPGSNYWETNYWSTQYWARNYWGGAQSSVFLGTFDVAGTRTGSIGVTLEALAPSTSGCSVQVENLDFTINMAVPWIEYEFGYHAGPLADTLEAFGGSLTGTFAASGAVFGSIAVTLDDDAPNFDGTHVAPASRSGTVDTTLGDWSGALTGQVFGAGSALGTISVTLEDNPADFDGTMAPGNKTGSFAVTLDTITTSITGVFATSGAVVGSIEETLDDLSTSAFGTSVGDPVVTAERLRGRSEGQLGGAGSKPNRISAGSRRGRKRA